MQSMSCYQCQLLARNSLIDLFRSAAPGLFQTVLVWIFIFSKFVFSWSKLHFFLTYFFFSEQRSFCNDFCWPTAIPYPHDRNWSYIAFEKITKEAFKQIRVNWSFLTILLLRSPDCIWSSVSYCPPMVPKFWHLRKTKTDMNCVGNF